MLRGLPITVTENDVSSRQGASLSSLTGKPAALCQQVCVVAAAILLKAASWWPPFKRAGSASILNPERIQAVAVK